MTTTDKIARFLDLADEIFRVADSAASAETKYELVFSDELGPRTLSQIVPLDYYDPDTSYEEDIAAYVAALREKCGDLREIAGTTTKGPAR
jgi:hypothetical protein